jgi:acetolactate synthase regulatory subunit
MTVVCSPRLSALTRIVAVLHARKAAVTSLQYQAGALQAELSIRVAPAEADRLAAQIRRLVEVTTVHVAVPAGVQVAS